MSILSLSEALAIQNESAIKKIEFLQAELELIPDSFFALFWLYTHDFLYISPTIEQVTGHVFKNFEKHGMVFFTSIIPPELIDNIYQTMNTQTEHIQKHPEYLFAEEFLHIKAAIYNTEKQFIPVNYNAVLLDEKTFDPISYLIFCSWIDTSKKTDFEVSQLEEYLREKLLELKNIYFQSKPDRFEFLKSKNKISNREREVAKLLSQGHSTKIIGELLHISFNTVESHRKNLLHKLSAKNTPELIYKLRTFAI